MELEPIEIKLKKCCLTCKHFDQSGIKGLVFWGSYCGCNEPKRVISCGHMEVCYKYKLEDADNE